MGGDSSLVCEEGRYDRNSDGDCFWVVDSLGENNYW